MTRIVPAESMKKIYMGKAVIRMIFSKVFGGLSRV